MSYIDYIGRGGCDLKLGMDEKFYKFEIPLTLLLVGVSPVLDIILMLCAVLE